MCGCTGSYVPGRLPALWSLMTRGKLFLNMCQAARPRATSFMSAASNRVWNLKGALWDFLCDVSCAASCFPILFLFYVVLTMGLFVHHQQKSAVGLCMFTVRLNYKYNSLPVQIRPCRFFFCLLHWQKLKKLKLVAILKPISGSVSDFIVLIKRCSNDGYVCTFS